jgi:3'-phosphoadenosine 5'-phosphosulfate sulfotransferase (PAPS reductase)/FAD synthetase
MDPFRVDGPAYVSFSGGRTSAFLLRRVLDANAEPPLVLFANTGKEAPETLDFVREVGRRWAVAIHWIERAAGGGFVEVDHASAARHGEPFAALIRERGYVPHPGAPYCSTELKFRPARDWMRARGVHDFRALVGLRADERRRVAAIRGRRVEGGIIETPLFDAGVDEGHVGAFWRAQPFDLGIHPHRGNCDLCFKKAGAKIAGLVDQAPELAAWWADQERATGTRWRNDRPTYGALADAARRQVRLPLLEETGDVCSLCA